MTEARESLRAAGLCGALFILYALGACRTIYVGDSGELVTAVHLLGIPHPTGYPLYVLLGKLWTVLLPVGSIAFRMSLFSAACAACACAVLYRLCRSEGLHPVASLTAALLLAFSPSFWGEANIQRVYSLNALFVVLVTAAAWRWHRKRDARVLALALFLAGLGAANHTFMAIYGIAVAAFATAVAPRLMARPSHLAAFGASFGAGLLPYLYLPLRSRANPRLDWGNPETLHNFLGVVLRRDFWQRAWIENPSDLLPIAADYLRSLAAETAWAGTALAVVGVGVWLWRRRDPIVLLPLIAMAENLAVMALHGSRADIFIWHRYYIPSYAMAALLAGLGCDALLRKLPPRFSFAPLAIPIILLATGWRSADRSRFRVGEDFSRTLLATAPPGAHLIAEDDNILFTLMYLHLVEGARPDVDLILQGVGEAELPPLRFNPTEDTVLFTHHPNWNVPTLDIAPVGLVYQAWPAGKPRPQPQIPKLRLEGETDPRVPKDYLTQNLIGQFHYMLGVTFEDRDWLRADREFHEAMAASPRNDVLFFNLGLIYWSNGLLDEAIGAFERSREINPRHIPNKDRPLASDKLAKLAAEKERLAGIERDLSSDARLRSAAAGSAEWHRRMAALLEERGEGAAARGHLRRAVEAESAERAGLG